MEEIKTTLDEPGDQIITTASDPNVSDKGDVLEIPKGEKILDLVYWPDKRLKIPAKEVSEFNEDLVALVNNMFGTMQHYGGVGLAGPQVGENKCLFVWAIGGQHGVMINPRITSFSNESKQTEQCLSFPGVTVTTRRADKITVEWQNIQGIRVEGEYEGLPAVCFQHEIEHLAGMTMISTLSGTKRDIVTRKMKKFKRMMKNAHRG